MALPLDAGEVRAKLPDFESRYRYSLSSRGGSSQENRNNSNVRSMEWTFLFSSTLLNILNFFLFDVVLITIIYHFTTDVSGRLNDADLRSDVAQNLILLGGGICATNRTRYVYMIFIRLLALLLILVSNTCITGKSGARVVNARAIIRIPGSLRNYFLF